LYCLNWRATAWRTISTTKFATTPKVSGDAGSVEQHKLTEQIKADRYLRSKEVARSERWGAAF